MRGKPSRPSSRRPSLATVEFSFMADGDAVRACEHPDCQEEGTYRAPRSRMPEQHGYYWFCLDHVQDYNARWDYYSGMSSEDIEKSRRDDITWNRPTWTFSTGNRTMPDGMNGAVHAAFRRFFGADWFQQSRSEAGPRNNAGARLAMEIQSALDVLMVTSSPITFADIKRAYKAQAKLCHPDLCRHDPEAENRFKAINHAFAVLKKHEGLFPG